MRPGSASEKLDEAVRLLNKQTAPATAEAAAAYRKLVTRLLSRSLEEEEACPDHAGSVSALRDVLYRLANQYRAQDKKQSGDVLEMLMATHYQSMLLTTKALGLKELASKCAVTLLKYPEYVPQDRAFYQAGMCCRDSGNVNLSFLLLNRCAPVSPIVHCPLYRRLTRRLLPRPAPLIAGMWT